MKAHHMIQMDRSFMHVAAETQTISTIVINFFEIKLHFIINIPEIVFVKRLFVR